MKATKSSLKRNSKLRQTKGLNYLSTEKTNTKKIQEKDVLEFVSRQLIDQTDDIQNWKTVPSLQIKHILS